MSGTPYNKTFRPHAIVTMYRRFSCHVYAYKRLLIWIALCMLGVTLTELIRPWPMKYIFDGVLIPAVSGQHSTLLPPALGDISIKGIAALAALSVVLIAVLNGLLTYGQTYLTARVAQGVTASIRQRVYSHLQHLSRSFHDQRRTGDLMVRLTGDVRLVQDMFVTSAFMIIDRLLYIVCMLGIMLWLDWRLTLVALAVVPVLAVVMIVYKRRIKQAAKQQRQRESQIASEMTEKLSAITIIQAFARQPHEQSQFMAHNENNVQASLTAKRLEAHLSRSVQIVIAVGIGAVVWFGVARVQSGVLTPGDLLVFSAYMKGLYKPLRKLSSTVTRIVKATVSGERLTNILDTQSDITDSPDAIDAGVLRGDIGFDRVSFRYGNNDNVLESTELHVSSGEHIALLGKSGAGKSTIANLVLRLYDPVEGVIRIDGVDIRDYTITSLREQIAFVLQDAMLFHTSIADNIAYGRLNADPKDIEAAARAANAHDFISCLPNGYATVVGERGDTLSGGQRQRIAIARALIRDASIVILDEPVSGLDMENREQVELALENLTRDRTCITITHDLNTALKADRIFELRDGKITDVTESIPAQVAAAVASTTVTDA